MNTYAMARATLDVDIVVELSDENLIAFESIFSKDYYINHNTIVEEIKRRGMFNVIQQYEGMKFDFIVRKDTPYRKLEFERRCRNNIADFEVWMVSPEDLIISKIDWIQQLFSDRQANDIKNLLDNPAIDKQYITDWCKKLNLNTYNLI